MRKLILILAFVFVFFEPAHAEEKNESPLAKFSPSELLAYSTVRIAVTLADGRVGTGTGFFYNFCEQEGKCIPAIITNKHVIKDAVKGSFQITLADAKGLPLDAKSEPISIDGFARYWIGHPDPRVDLIAMPIGSLINSEAGRGVHLFYFAFDKSLIPTEKDLSELTAVEEILMIGYPTGLWDSINNFPIFRKGITATHPAKNYNGNKEFVIDAACFPGSSGSPVLLYNSGSYTIRGGGLIAGTRIKLLGILYAGPQYTNIGEIVVVDIPTRQVPIVKEQIPTNLGYVIKSQAILDFEEIFKSLFKE